MTEFDNRTKVSSVLEHFLGTGWVKEPYMWNSPQDP